MKIFSTMRNYEKCKVIPAHDYSSDIEHQFEQYIDELKTSLFRHKIHVITAPHDQVGGDDGNEYIMLKIRICDVLLALHTETSSSSAYFDQEIGIALAYKVPIVPICIKTKPYGFIQMKKCISCDDFVVDKTPQIVHAIKKQYWNQRGNQLNILFRLNVINPCFKAIQLLNMIAGKPIQEGVVDQLAIVIQRINFSVSCLKH